MSSVRNWSQKEMAVARAAPRYPKSVGGVTTLSATAAGSSLGLLMGGMTCA